MIGIFIALMVALGVGGTATVADNARPGDALFGVDRAVENVRLSISGEEKKNELRIRFAEERVKEIEELVEEEAVEGEDVTEAESEKQMNVSTGIEATLNLLADVKEQEGENPTIDEIISKLNAYAAGLPSDAKVEVGNNKIEIKFESEESDDDDDTSVEIKREDDDNKSKVEIRTEDERIKIEMKDGVLEIKTKIEDEDDGDDDSDKEEGLEEIEAKVFSDKTIVEVELNDEKTTFTTSANTRTAIIGAIIAQFPSLTSAQVEAVLEIENEDDDVDDEEDDSDDESDDSDDDSDDDDDDDDEDEDEDDDDSDDDEDEDEDDDDNSGSDND